MSVEDEIGIVRRIFQNSSNPIDAAAQSALVKADIAALENIAHNTVFTSYESAKELIDALGALSIKPGGDPGIRGAALDAAERLVEELNEDEEDGKISLGVRDKNIVGDSDDDDSADPDALDSDEPTHVTDVALAIAAASQTTKHNTPLTRKRRTELMLDIAENGPTPEIRMMAIEGAVLRMEKFGATDEQLGTLTLLGSEMNADTQVRQASLAALKLHRPELHPSTQQLVEQAG